MFGGHSRNTNLRVQTLLLDISDLISYLFHHRHPSGIQRVQCNIVINIRRVQSTSRFLNVCFVIIDEATNCLMILDENLVCSLISSLRHEEVSHENVRSQLEEIRRRLTPFDFNQNSIYVITGAFWNFPGASRIYKILKSSGIIIGCLVYDLIPITHPEFCAAPLVRAFKRALARGLSYYDFAVAISDHTANDLANYIRSNSPRKILIKPIPLAHTIEDSDGSRIADGSSRSADIPPFILCVGTIEARKNHRYLFHLWKMMLEERRISVPKLIIVGRWGWRVNDLREQLEATNYLDGHVIVLNEVDDQTLSWLYRECLFTIFSSYVEGWGLPVGESIAHGRVCVASNSSSIPEVADKFAIYIDPFNVRHGKKVVEDLVTERKTLSEMENKIQREFKQRSWIDYTENFASGICELIAHPEFSPYKPARAAIEINEFVFLDEDHSSNVHRSLADLNNIENVLDENWFEGEPIGRWLKGYSGGMKFYLHGNISGIVHIELAFVTAPWIFENRLELKTNVEHKVYNLSPSTRFLTRLALDVKNSYVECSFKIGGNIDSRSDHRSVAVALFALRVVTTDDLPRIENFSDTPYPLVEK